MPMPFFSLGKLPSKDLPDVFEGVFLRGANVFRALPTAWPPSGGKSPRDDWVLKTPLAGWRSGKDWSTELNDDEVEEDFDVANWLVRFCKFESPLAIVDKDVWFSLVNNYKTKYFS